MSFLSSVGDFLHDQRYPVLLVSLVVIAWSAVRLIRIFMAPPQVLTSKAPAPGRRPPPLRPPLPGRPTPAVPAGEGAPEIAKGGIDAGIAGHQQRGSAKTVKIPVQPPTATEGGSAREGGPSALRTPLSFPPQATADGDRRGDRIPERLVTPPQASAAAALTPAASTPAQTATTQVGLGAARSITPPAPAAPTPGPAASAPSAALVPASRSATPQPAAPEVGTESKADALRRQATRMEELGFHHGISSQAPLPASEAPGSTSGSKAATPARSQTAELTSILERIDKFLAEDQPSAAPATASAPTPTATPGAAPAAPSAQAAATVPAPSQPPAAAPAAPAAGSDETPAATKKAPPLWARGDALDADAEAEAKPSSPAAKEPPPGKADGQERLF